MKEKIVRISKSRLWTFGGLVFLGIASELLIPYAMSQWTYDRSIGILHIGVGAALFIVGVVLILQQVLVQCKNNHFNAKNVLLRAVLTFAVFQLIAGTILGLCGVVLQRHTGMSQQYLQVFIYVLTVLIQGELRMVWVGWNIYHLRPEHHQIDKKMIALLAGCALVFSVVGLCFELVKVEAVRIVIQAVWESACIMFYLCFFWEYEAKK